jgi:peptidyl-dipeptidase Dcp
MTPDNPFATASDLPYGLPPFDRITDEHFGPAFDAGLAEHAAEIEAIADNPEPVSFENTLVALEASGRLLHRVSTVFFKLTSSDTNPARQRLQVEIAPRLAAHDDAIYLNPKLFARVRRLYEQRAELGLETESAWLLERVHAAFRRAGAGLPERDRQRLRTLNEELSTLRTAFQQNLLRDTNDLAILVDDPGALAGLSAGAIAAAGEAANARGEHGKYLLTLSLPSSQPLLAVLENRELRERLFRASAARGNRGNENDNTAVLARMAALRAERAKLLGYPHHAAYVISDQTARTSEAVLELLRQLVPAAVANAKRDSEELQRYLGADIPGATLQPWDWAFYADRVRKATFDVDDATLRPYFELGRVISDGVFHAANRLYGLTFTERHDLPKYHPDVRVFEVFDADGSPLGLFLGDYYARDAKRGGAWMSNFVDQSGLLGDRAVVVNNLNIAQPPPGEPTLLSVDQVRTAFHEFGHAIHGLLSTVEYPRFSGTNVPLDFSEYPSQVNEMWTLWPEILANYARHHETGEPLPQHLVERLAESAQYGQGFSTTEYLAAALLDLAWHTLTTDDRVDDVARFEADALEKAGLALSSVPPRYRSTYFAHIFAGEYSAGYYSYIWSEVLDADTVQWFQENGGLTRANGDHFRHELISRGGSLDAMTAFRAFRGRDPHISPLLARRGLASHP